MHEHDHANPVTNPGSSALKPTPFAEYRGRAREVVGAAIKRAEESLAGSFDGITIGGGIPEGLYPIAGTGISVQPQCSIRADSGRVSRPGILKIPWTSVSTANSMAVTRSLMLMILIIGS